MHTLVAKIRARLAGIEPRHLPELLTSLFAALMLSVFPLLALGGYENITAGKFGLWVYMCADYGAALVLLFILGRRQGWTWLPTSGWAGRLWARWGWCERCLVLFLLLSLISALFSESGTATLLGLGRYDGLLTRSLLVLMALAASTLGRWRPGLAELSAGVTLIMCLIALVQLGGGDPFSLYPTGCDYFDGGQRYVGRFLSTIGNVDLLSAYFCLALPLALWGVIKRPGWQRVLCGAAVLASVAVMYLMEVSASWLALAVAGVVCLVLSLPPRWRRLALFLLALVILLGLAWLYWGEVGEEGFFYEASSILHGRVEDEFGSSRILIWREALGSMEGCWLLGSGPGTKRTHFTTVFQRQAGPVTLKAAVRNAHSEYVDILLEGGLPSLAAYLLALAALARRALACWARPGVAALSGAVLAYAVQAAFCSGSVVITPLFWLLLGLLAASCKKEDLC